MRHIIGSIEAEYQRYKALGEGAIAQLDEAELSTPGPNAGNSVAVIVWHLSGNLASRFTDFLTSDGEKPWRHREEEFAARTVTREELMDKWRQGWTVLFEAVAGLTDDRLEQQVTIRGQPLAVHDRAAPITRARQLSRGADRLSRQVAPEGPVAASEYPARRVCRVQPGPDARAA